MIRTFSLKSEHSGAMTDTLRRPNGGPFRIGEGQTMWNDTEVQQNVENEIYWELRTGLKEIAVAVKAGAVDLAGHRNYP